jgi:hypothetical protein
MLTKFPRSQKLTKVMAMNGRQIFHRRKKKRNDPDHSLKLQQKMDITGNVKTTKVPRETFAGEFIHKVLHTQIRWQSNCPFSSEPRKAALIRGRGVPYRSDSADSSSELKIAQMACRMSFVPDSTILGLAQCHSKKSTDRLTQK